MRIISFAHQRLALRYTELVLFIDDHQSQLRQIKAAGQQGVRADVQGAAFGVSRRCHAFRLLTAGLQGQADAERREPFLKGSEMLFRQNFRGGHQRHVETGFQGHQCTARRHRRFAGPDIPLQQPAHGMFAAKIRSDLAQHARLRPRELEAERR